MIDLRLDAPFGQPGLKIVNALNHLNWLIDQVHTYQKGLVVRPALVRDESGLTLIIEVCPNWIPASIPCLIGDVVHNLRAALDYMINEICRTANPGREYKRLHFPFHEDKQGLENAVKNLVTKNGLPVAIGDIIMTRIKPWNKPESTGNSVLSGLNRLDNADKHRLLVPTLVVTAVTGFSCLVTGGNIRGALNDMTVTMRPIEGHTTHFGSYSSIAAFRGDISDLEGIVTDPGIPTYDLILGDAPPFSGEPVVPLLEHIVELTLDVFNTLYLHLFGVETGITILRNPRKEGA
jgi:hypothetical protein